MTASEACTPIFALAFDHRASFARELLSAGDQPGPLERARLVDAKRIILESVWGAIEEGAPIESAAVLIDEEFGAELALEALAGGLITVMPVDRSGQREFNFEYGNRFRQHIEEFHPAFAKPLVYFNPEADANLNRRQLDRLCLLSKWLRTTSTRLMVELIVPPTEDQLKTLGNARARFERELRPRLQVEAIQMFQGAGIEADVWKVEGSAGPADCQAIGDAVQLGDRSDVRWLLLGGGATFGTIGSWMQAAATAPGFAGFAVGRSLWSQPLRRHLAGEISRTEASSLISREYLNLIGRYRDAVNDREQSLPVSIHD